MSACATAPRFPLDSRLDGPDKDIAAFTPVWREHSPGISYCAALIGTPRLSIRAVQIELDTQELELVVGPDSLPTRGIFTTSFAQERGCIVAINANPFTHSSAIEGQDTRIVGIAIQDGRVFAAPEPRYAALVFPYAGPARVLAQRELPPLKAGQTQTAFRWAIGGFFVVLRDGAPTGHPTRRYPRAAAALSQDGTVLILLTIDGRKPGLDMATEIETGQILARLGGHDGLILDGGGSTTLALRQNDGSIATLNSPMHRFLDGQQRAVAVCLGIRKRR